MSIVDAKRVSVEGLRSSYSNRLHLWVQGQGILCDNADLKAHIVEKMPQAITATKTEVAQEWLCPDCYRVIEDPVEAPAEEAVGVA